MPTCINECAMHCPNGSGPNYCVNKCPVHCGATSPPPSSPPPPPASPPPASPPPPTTVVLYGYVRSGFTPSLPVAGATVVAYTNAARTTAFDMAASAADGSWSIPNYPAGQPAYFRIILPGGTRVVQTGYRFDVANNTTEADVDRGTMGTPPTGQELTVFVTKICEHCQVHCP